MADSLAFEWRCEGCGKVGVYDAEFDDIFGVPFHICPLIKSPLDPPPSIHIYEKEKTDEEENSE